MDELDSAIRTWKNKKGTELAEIPAEIWKIECLNEQLLEIFQKSYHRSAPEL